MDALANEERTMIFYESPMRLVKTLELFKATFGPERKAAVSRELTKMFEEVTTAPLQELADYYREKDKVKGEIVLVVAGK
mgnify:CR=1 FL=1